jgi:hypothetical protein
MGSSEYMARVYGGSIWEYMSEDRKASEAEEARPSDRLRGTVSPLHQRRGILRRDASAKPYSDRKIAAAGDIGELASISEYIGVYGSIWEYMGVYRSIWKYIGVHGGACHARSNAPSLSGKPQRRESADSPSL